MGKFLLTQNTFEKGEIGPEFFSRENIQGLSVLQNMDVLSGGGLSRRSGLKYITDINDNSRLVPFVMDENQNFILAISDERIRIIQDGEIIQTLISDWGVNDLSKLQYAQRFNTIIFVHPDYPPQILKQENGLFQISEYGFETNDDMQILMPFMKFDDMEDVKITVTSNSNGNNFATFKTNKDFWSMLDINNRFYLLDKQWVIYEFVNSKEVIAICNGSYTVPTDSIADWYESAFNSKRGYPISITFHQDRLVFGGTKSWPSGIWMSKVGNHRNFDVGTGLDDEAIFITLVSTQRQQISTIVSSDNLQILTSTGEWAISNKPLTPASVDIMQHTSVGSVVSKYLKPQQISGKTVFLSSSEKDIRELSLDEISENYNANDLCALSKHLMNNPTDMAYNDKTGQLFVVMANGDMAVLNKNVNFGISAWGTYKTNGLFKSVAVMDGETFVVVARDSKTNLEKFSADEMIDAGLYDFSFTASSLPMLSSKHPIKNLRIRSLSARVLNTKSLFLNEVRATLPNEIYDEGSLGYSGDVSVNFLGTNYNTLSPVWTISGSEPLPATVLSMTVNGWFLI